MEIAALLNQAQLNSLASPSSSSSTSTSSSSSSSPSLISLHAAKKSHINVNHNHNHPSSSSSSSSISSSPQPSSLLTDNRHRKSNSVLHVRENSLDELEALFDPSRRTSRANLPPLHKRNLPSSFFTQPSANSPKLRHSHRLNHHHGRQMSSIDQSTYSSAKYNNQESPNHVTNVNGHSMSPFSGGNQTNGNGLVVTTANTSLQPMSANNHLRSISEPVNMMNMSGSQIQVEQQPLQQLHQNILNNSQNSQLPYGWQSAKTSDNRVYYIK